jgi:hypothetical protein
MLRSIYIYACRRQESSKRHYHTRIYIVLVLELELGIRSFCRLSFVTQSYLASSFSLFFIINAT